MDFLSRDRCGSRWVSPALHSFTATPATINTATHTAAAQLLQQESIMHAVGRSCKDKGSQRQLLDSAAFPTAVSHHAAGVEVCPAHCCCARNCRQQEKEPQQMRKELSGVMRQISSSVAFLPLLADLCE